MLKYIGRGVNGDFLPGIPARDLTTEEAEAHGGTEFLIATGLYQAADGSSPLTIIKGIGQERARDLNELYVFSLRDLATVSPVTLADKLDGVSLEMVQDWQTQAQELLDIEETHHA